MRHAILILPLCGPALAAEVCPDFDLQVDRQAAVHDALQAAEGEAAAREISQELWEIWLDAPDEAAQALLDEGMARRVGFDFLGAEATLTRLIDYCPDYAEGWNQRAFSRYLRQDFPAALEDLDAAIARNPAHVAALAGKALTLIGLGRNEEAQQVLRDALALNPWLSERALLTEPPGEEL